MAPLRPLDSQTLDRLRQQLRTRAQLLADGVDDRGLRKAVRDGRLLRPSAGWYVRRAEWEASAPEDRHLLLMLAVQERAFSPPVFCSLSAAILHGIPVYDFGSSPAHVLCSSGRRSSDSRLVRRHAWGYRDEDLTRIAGFEVTSLRRTLVDIARSSRAERAIGCLDAGVNELLGRRSVDRAVWGDARDELVHVLEELPQANGSVRARGLIGLADPLAESPLESVSRLYLLQLGFEVVTQVEVPAPHTGVYRVDFEFPGLRFFGEVDGKKKYLDEALRRGKSLDEILYEEKKREDWIRGTEQKGMARWGRGALGSAGSLGGRLGSFGLTPPLARPMPLSALLTRR